MNAKTRYLLSAMVTTMLLAAPTAQSAGDPKFCETRPDGIYTHPVCSYVYKCVNKATWQIPQLPGHFITMPNSWESPTQDPSDPNFCAQLPDGFYAHANCRTYSLCWQKNTYQVQRPADSLLGPVPAAK